MEESKSVPGARKVRKQSSGGRSGRSSRKSSLSSVASLTDSEIPDTPELIGSENVETPKKIIPNGTHSDEDQIIEQSKKKDIDVALAEGSKDKVDEAVKDGTSDKQSDDKNSKNVNSKTENINILNINPEQETQSTESNNKGKITEKDYTVEKNEAETLLNEKSKELKSKEVHDKPSDKEGLGSCDKEKISKKKVVNKVKVSDSATKIEEKVTFESKGKNKSRRISIDDKKGNVKTESTKTEISVKEKLSVTDSDKKQDNLAENKLSLNKKDISLVNKNKKNESSSSKELSKKVEDKIIVDKIDDEKIKLEGTNKESNSESESSDLNRFKSDDDSSEDGSNKKLDFVGFETPSNEKSTMFFRILDDIRIDDSVMEEMADGEGDTESEKRDEDISMENFILEDDRTDYEGDDCDEDIFAPEVVCVPMTGGVSYQFNKDDILSTTSSTPSLSSVKSGGSVPRKRLRDRSIKKPPLDLSHPQYLKPFEYGWKRELVFRSVSETGTSRRNADIYYYTPKGKKVRSTREVVENLTDPELTIDNFTFFKEPIGINDPEKEIIREAKIRGDRDLNATPPPAKKPALPKILKLSDGKSPKPSPLAIDVPMKEVDQNEVKKSDELSPPKATGFSLTPKIVLKSLKAPNKGKPAAKPLFTHPAKTGVSKDKRRQDSEDELEMGMLPPLWPTPPEKGTAREILPSTNLTEGFMANGDCFPNTSSSFPVPTSCRTPFLHSSFDRVTGSSKTIEVCSIRCPLAMGLIPTLQCHLCLCLYHPECVGLEEAINRTIHSYVCKNCQEAKKGGISGTALNKVTPPVLTSPPPLTPISTLGANSNAGPSSSATPPKLQRLTDAKLPTTSKSQKIVGGVTTWLPPSSMIQLTSKNTSSKTSVPAVATVETASALGSMPAQTLMSMNGKRYVVVPKHNVLSVSPAITTSGLSITDPQSPSTFVSSNSPTVETTVSPSNGSGSTTLTTSNPPSTNTSVSINCSTVPSNSNNSSNKNGNNVPILSKLPGPNLSDPSSRSYAMNNPMTPTNPPGVLLVPCVATANNTKEGSKFMIVNGPSGVPSGNFVIGNIPLQQQLQLPAVPTTQPAVPSNE